MSLAARMGRNLGAAAIASAILIAADARALFIVNQPWVKPGSRNSEGYMILTSTEGATLVGVSSSIAQQVRLRGAGARAGKRTLPLPAGAAIELKPGADRIVLTGLKRRLQVGDRVPLTLQIETANGARQEIAVDAEVRTESPYEAERRAHRH